MSQMQVVKNLLLNGNEVSNRLLEEAPYRMNHPSSPRRKAINSLIKAGFDIDPKGYPRINPNTGKDYKIWKIKFKE